MVLIVMPLYHVLVSVLCLTPPIPPLSGWVGVEGLSKEEEKKEKTQGHRHQCGDCCGWAAVEEGKEGINGDGWRLDLGW